MHELFEFLLRAIGEAGIGLTSFGDEPMTFRQWAAWLALLVILLIFGGIAILGMGTSPR